ncbi:hypothetical protein [Streptomyces buecherae]|uniref:hypothetical protein n=1 Tax=Streptomyces buecherae TaxID=2763006 RepID=UPI0037BB9B0F
MSSQSPELDYHTEPAQFRTNSTQSLALKGQKKTSGESRLTRVVLQLPRGSAQQDLTGQDAGALGVTSYDSRVWRAYKRNPSRNHIEIGIEAKDPDGNAVKTVGFQITGITVNAVAGNAPCTVHEYHPKENGPRTRALPALAKLDGTFALGNLQPTQWLLKAGESTTLTWQVTTDGKHKVADYTLTHTTPNGPRTTKPGPTAWSAPLGPLHQDSAAVLTATVHPGDLTITQVTYLAVREPLLSQVATLSALGPVTVMDWPYNGAGPVPGYTRDDHRTERHTARFTSSTDGLIHLSIEADSDAIATVELQLAHQEQVLHTQKLVTRHENHMTLPVPVGHVITLTASARSLRSVRADGSPPGYQLALDWQPLGMGALRTVPR